MARIELSNVEFFGVGTLIAELAKEGILLSPHNTYQFNLKHCYTWLLANKGINYANLHRTIN
jgi:hypothetical protein